MILKQKETLSFFMKKLRLINGNERLIDMAARLNVSISYLSSVESGKRKLNDKTRDLITQEYKLTKEEKHNLTHLRDIAASNINISLDSFGVQHKETLVNFISNVNDLSKNQLDQIDLIVNKRKKGDSDDLS